MSALYGEEFFEEVERTARASALRVVPVVVRTLRPRHVVDVGCGEGVWAATFEALGVPALGVDAGHVRAERRLVRRFLVHDLTEPLPPLGRFDLCVCLEVAEHLPASAADDLVRSLAGVADHILFSAALPGQGGTGHVNEQPHRYWLERFDRCGFDADERWRDRFADDEDVAWWYRQNLVLLRRRQPRPDHWPYLPPIDGAPPPATLPAGGPGSAAAPGTSGSPAPAVAGGALPPDETGDGGRRPSGLHGHLAEGRRRWARVARWPPEAVARRRRREEAAGALERAEGLERAVAALAHDVEALRQHLGHVEPGAVGTRLRRLEYLVEQLHGPLLRDRDRGTP